MNYRASRGVRRARATASVGLVQQSAIEADPRWKAICERDASADRTFVYGVRTTGVYCAPSCRARRARPENVSFHSTPEDAEREGFRPCKRCRPDEAPRARQRDEAIAKLCRRIEESADAVPLDELAAMLGASASHAHRLFKERTGLTPREYAAAVRARRAREALGTSASVTEAIYQSGYSSSGRFYERSTDALGMRPSEYRNGAEFLQIRYALCECSLGHALVAVTDKGVCAVLFADESATAQSAERELVDDLRARFSKAKITAATSELDETVRAVVAVLDAPMASSSLPLDIRGTLFQQRVWEALRRIRPGETQTYTQLAEALGAPNATRAVASACAANPIAVLIGCHRVLRADGSLAGYRWGLDRKRALLDRERRGR